MFFIKRALVAIAFVLFIPGAQADGPTNKGMLNIQISNQTGEACTLKHDKTKTIHGKLCSSPPGSLAINQSMSFDMEQTYLYGPDEKLAYQCGSHTIEFEIQQDHTVIVGSTPVFKIINSQGLTATLDSAHDTSPFWNAKGTIEIALKPQ